MFVKAFQQNVDRLALAVDPIQRNRSLARKGIVGDISLQTATLTTAAQRTVQLHFGVPQLHPKTLRATIDPMVHHESHANAVFKGDDGKISREGFNLQAVNPNSIIKWNLTLPTGEKEIKYSYKIYVRR